VPCKWKNILVSCVGDGYIFFLLGAPECVCVCVCACACTCGANKPLTQDMHKGALLTLEMANKNYFTNNMSTQKKIYEG
jgi:hypothetical protein